MKIISLFTHPQAIRSVYDFLLSDKYNWSYIKKRLGSSKLYNGSEWGQDFEAQKTPLIHHKKYKIRICKEKWFSFL